MTTDERLANVERERACLRAELAACVRTRAVQVVDENGMTRAVLDVLKIGPMLSLSDAAGKPIWSAP